MCSGWYLNAETSVYHPSAGKANALCAFCQHGGLLGAEEAFRGMFLQRWCLPAELRNHNRRSIGIHTHEAGTLTRDQPEAGPQSIPSLSEQLHGRLKAISQAGGHGVRGRSLASNRNKHFHLYYISVQSDSYTTQTYILSTDNVL